MEKNEEYVERLEKIIYKQDNLLTHLDAKFDQQQALNENLEKQNQVLREDIKKHKTLLMDMNKTVNQHKNVVKKLKKELEDQLKIQQDLHKDYGEIIKGLTDELEEEKVKNGTLTKNDKKAPKDSDKVELPPKDFEKDYVSSASNFVKDVKDKSEDVIGDLSKQEETPVVNQTAQSNNGKCPNCGAEVLEGYVFCESCGTKLN
jgi:DNA repair exonuclease SbcCD ATPase subunit